MILLRVFIFLLTGTLIFSLFKFEEFCSVNSTAEMIKAIFLESKNLALEYGESHLIFSQDKARITVMGSTKKIYKLTSSIQTPPITKKACSNVPGTPTSKTEFRFSPKGLKDLSGTIYIRCGNRFLAFSVLSPTAGVTYCVLNGDSWEVVN